MTSSTKQKMSRAITKAGLKQKDKYEGDNIATANIGNDTDSVQVNDFIRDIELSAKKILRDDKRLQNRKCSIKPYNHSHKRAPISHVQLSKENNALDEQSICHNGLHLKLKGSPFYEAWEEWSKSKSAQKESSGRGGLSFKGNDGIYMKKVKEDSIKAYLGRNKPKEARKENRFDMKVHLTSNYLRKRFRCDQNLQLDQRNNNAAMLVQKEMPLNQKLDNNEPSKKRYLKVEKTDEIVEDTVAPNIHHPLEESLFNHVNTITTRFKAMAQNNLESMPGVKDMQSCWDLNKKRYSSHLSNTEDFVSKAENKDSRSSELFGDNCQLQSVPLHQATQSFINVASTNQDNKAHNNSESPARANEEKHPFTCDETESNENNPSSFISITPECWPLVAVEGISNGTMKLSIHLMKNRSGGEEEEPMKDPFEYWIIDFHDQTLNKVKSFVLLDKEVDAAIAKLCVAQTIPSQTEEEVVYVKEITKEVCGSKIDGVYTVSICLNEKHQIIAIITIKFDDIESRYGTTRNAPMKFICPVYEIVARLDILHVCRTRDYKFWLSKMNGNMIWGPLLDQIKVDLDADEIIGGDQIKSFIAYWCTEEVNQVEIKWIQPSIVHSDEYFATLKKAYELLHRFEVADNEQHLVMVLNNLSRDQASRSAFVIKKQEEMLKLPPQSLRLLGHLAFSKDLVPGACTIGERGIGFASKELSSDESEAISFQRESDLDLSQAVAYFQRNQSKKGTPFTKVTIVLALERPILTTSFHTWDPIQVSPSFNECRPPANVIPSEMAEGKTIMTEPLQSVIDTWIPPPIISRDDPSSLNHPKWKLENLENSNEIFQSNGFRLKCQAHEIFYDKTIESKGYGISKKALSPNQTGVNSRSHWSSKEYCTQLLSKERGADDFFHLLQNECTDKDGGLINQPLISIIQMKAYDFKCLKGIRKDKYTQAKEMRHLRRKSEEAKCLLSRKIASADELMVKRLHDQLCTEEEFYFDSKFVSQEEEEDVSSKNGTAKEANEPGVEYESPSTKIVPLNDGFSDDTTLQLQGYGWRKLPKSTLGVDFFELNKRKIQTSTQGSLVNRCNKVHLIGRVDAKECIEYKSDDTLFAVKLETKFIDDVLIDRMGVSRTIDNQKLIRERLLTANQQEALEHILNVPLNKPKAVLEHSVGNNTGDDIPYFAKKEQEMKEDVIVNNSHYMLQKKERDIEDMKVLLAVKHANYDALKDFLDHNGIDVDTYDEFGNTLFILACQQGNKKLCKFLLRRGAYINAQNHTGNTGLHYLFEYGHSDLAEYIRQKGADDSYLNAEGLTCFEGVHRTNLEEL